MIEGIYVPLFTSFNSDDTMDVDRTVAHAELVASKGVTGLVPFGTFGEGSSLSLSEKKILLAALTEALPDTRMVPTLISNSFGDALEFIKFANELPLKAIMLSPPNFFRPIPDEQLTGYFSRISKLSSHPIIAYNIPAFSLSLSPAVIKSSGVWGVKDSSGNFDVLENYISAGNKVLVGQDVLLVRALVAGAFGGIMGFANLFPRQMMRIYELVRGGQVDEADEILTDVIQAIRCVVPGNSDFISTIGILKSMSGMMGHVSLGDMRSPLPSQTVSQHAQQLFLELATRLESKY